MTIKVTRPQIDLREEINKALTLQGLETQSITVNGFASKGKLDVGGTAKANQYLLEAIDKTKSEVAVDVFVYDTSKDSDGGAWRHRTQNTSWYNETLNTATRGSRREFPSVAVFVAEAARVTIYDGDDPNLPMWMEWNTTGALGWASGTDSGWITLTVLNGIFAWGCDNRGCGFANFVKDKIEVVHGAQRYVLKDESIALRETNVGVEMSAGDALGGYSFPASNDEIYDVAATVLPNAPIDPDSGLPRPTLAYAGPAGLNIITDTGETILITAGAGSAYDGVSWVEFTENYNLIFEQDNSTNPRSVFCIPVPTANRTTQTNDGLITDKVVMKWYDNDAHKPYPVFSGGGVVEAIPMAGDNQAMRSDVGKLTLLEPNVADPAQGKVAYIGADYNTGWMHGDTRLSVLSNTNPTDVVSPEILADTGFTSGTSNWVAVQASISAGSNKLTITPDSGVNGGVYHLIDTVVGETYVFKIKVLNDPAGYGRIFAGTSNDINNSDKANLASKYGLFNGEHFITFTATSTTSYIWIEVGGGTQQATEFDDVNLRIAVRDHTEYQTGCQVIGTIAKDPVATGADLVAYSGFTTSNYIWQPFNDELDFTDEMSIMFWVKDWAASTDLLHRGPFNTRNSQTSFYLYNDGGYDYRFTLTSDGSTEQNFEIAGVGNRSGWQHVCFTLKNGEVRGYLNGYEHAPVVSFSGNIYNQNTGGQNGLFIGDGPVSGHFTGSLALLRISATAPDLDQIAAMYNDEKHLFKENAKATLAGDDGHVRAMAYDDDTEILHIGTLKGRSDYQGLRRVDETTDEIAFALSASNGMVAGE